MSKKRVLVAMSGGVDSSVAAALLLEQGYDVEGATMQIWPDLTDEEECAAVGCCSLSAVDDARRVAYRLGIKYHVFNFKDIFNDQVIEPFIDEYLRGRTPNPCILCNRTVKFEALMRRAMVLGFDYLATGHYARIDRGPNGRLRLLRCKDNGKDQTYALYNIKQETLAHMLFPTGDMQKPDVRRYAEKIGLSVADKPDSQEICFVRDNDYAGFIRSRRPESELPPESGDFVDTDGNVIGRHRGIIHYTVGQRKGLGVTFGEPRYVLSIDAENNRIVLGRDSDTYSSALIADDLNFISVEPPDKPISVTAKVRYTGADTPARIIPLSDGRCRVEFDPPVRAVTPGQAVVFYDGDVVVGGGTIQKSL